VRFGTASGWLFVVVNWLVIGCSYNRTSVSSAFPEAPAVLPVGTLFEVKRLPVLPAFCRIRKKALLQRAEGKTEITRAITTKRGLKTYLTGSVMNLILFYTNYIYGRNNSYIRHIIKLKHI
jgi:hypothetical protein